MKSRYSHKGVEPPPLRSYHSFVSKTARFTKGVTRLWQNFWTVFVFLTIFGGFRIGEASVPGPSSDSSHWTLGVVNPSGLQGKSHIMSTVPADVIAISETHLTASSKNTFFNSLKATRVGFSHFVSGSPMAPRSNASEAGDWAGVAVASKYPCRSLSVQWPPDLTHFALCHIPFDLLALWWSYLWPPSRNHTPTCMGQDYEHD